MSFSSFLLLSNAYRVLFFLIGRWQLSGNVLSPSCAGCMWAPYTMSLVRTPSDRPLPPLALSRALTCPGIQLQWNTRSVLLNKCQPWYRVLFNFDLMQTITYKVLQCLQMLCFVWLHRGLPLWSMMCQKLLSWLWSRWTQSCWGGETLRLVVWR